MAAHQGFSVSHDGEMANFQIMKAAVLASEARRKEEQRMRRQKLGLPDIEGMHPHLGVHDHELTVVIDQRGFVTRIFHSGKKSRSS